jgi:hypothetical protein
MRAVRESMSFIWMELIKDVQKFCGAASETRRGLRDEPPMGSFQYDRIVRVSVTAGLRTVVSSVVVVVVVGAGSSSTLTQPERRVPASRTM